MITVNKEEFETQSADEKIIYIKLNMKLVPANS